MNDIVLLKHWIERERRARKEAERIGEEKITELFKDRKMDKIKIDV